MTATAPLSPYWDLRDREEPLPPRLVRLRAQVMGRHGSFVNDPNPYGRDAALWKALHAERGASVVQVRARHLLELARSAPVRLFPDWSILGEHLPHSFGLLSPKPADAALLEPLGIPADRAAEAEACVRRWTDRDRMKASVGAEDPGTAKGRGVGSVHTVFLAFGWMENHSIRDHAKVLRIGFRGIRREVEAAIAGTDVAAPDAVQRLNFLKAALLVCEAGETLGRRYAQLAAREGLTEASEACARVPAEGARTLREAVQSLWLSHVLACGEDGINANSIGRLDRLLQPYYGADLAAGRVTPGEALELMEELACKLYLDYDVQAVTLGGVDADGTDAVSPMSRIILEASGHVGFVRDLSVRVTDSTPPDFLESACALAARGGGVPFFFHDAPFLRALTDRGLPVEDARDYAPIGCVELTVPGKANPHAVSGWINAAQCLELALFDGTDPVTGEAWGPRTGGLAAHGTFGALQEAFLAQLGHFSRNMVHGIGRGELAQRELGPLPAWSVLTDDCIRRGRDITDGGALYDFHSICFLGTANVADSLMALKRLVYEKRAVEPSVLLEALRADFRGHEALRQALLREPKYGNDDAEVDGLAAWTADRFIDMMDGFRSPLGGRFHVHLFSFLMNVSFGKSLGATPDGRHAGEPVAYSLSAQQGRDRRGATPLLCSLARLPHHRAAGGSAAIVDLDPSAVEGPEGARRLSQLVRGAFSMGVGQLQCNVVTEERLRLAQKEPETWGNIPVRVAGYSQMFRLLTPELQEHVIARTKHRG